MMIASLQNPVFKKTLTDRIRILLLDRIESLTISYIDLPKQFVEVILLHLLNPNNSFHQTHEAC